MGMCTHCELRRTFVTHRPNSSGIGHSGCELGERGFGKLNPILSHPEPMKTRVDEGKQEPPGHKLVQTPSPPVFSDSALGDSPAILSVLLPGFDSTILCKPFSFDQPQS